ncbi:PD-(D/E)XK nuclease family protein [Sorangium sp. So ce426]|uniref:PD-(D/E)XK nuclease family protein n=1 Tax=Sorangium sp. So ce426 TaxID=3133312 RepID=UPI003F5B95AE
MDNDRFTEAIARVVAAAARVAAQRKEAAGRIHAVARLGERAIDPQRWIDALQEAVQRAERTGLVPSLFDVMGLYGSERHHNRALAWLVSVDADHGAGRAVLLAIARGLGCKELEADLADFKSQITVRSEMRWPEGAGSSREPDLLVLSPRALLLIENKVSSGEGSRQYEEYHEALQRLAKTRGAVEACSFLAAPHDREVPPNWTGMVVHRDLARWVSSAAQAEGMTAWGRALCLLVAEEIHPSGRANHLRAAKALLARVGGGGRFRSRDAREAQEILEGLGEAEAPWRG